MSALVLAFLVVKSAAPVRDADTFWHVASGRLLLEDWSLVGPDPVSPFTRDPWIRHAFLGDLWFAAMDDLGGPRLLAVALPVMTALVVLVLYVVLRRTAGILLSTVLVTLAFLTMSGSISLRPQVISFAGTAAVTGLWLAWTRGRGQAYWWVVPITWLWACFHGLWLLSPAVGAAVVAGAALDHRSLRGMGRPASAVAASALAGLVTPVGPALLLAPLQVRTIAPYIQEWQPDPWDSIPMLALYALLALTVAAWVAARQVPSFSHVALIVLAVVLGVTAARTVGTAGVIAACTTAAVLGPLLPPPREEWSRPELLRSVAAVVVGVLAAGALIAGMPRAVAVYPASGFSVLDRAPKGTVVCTDYEAGSWLLWRHPGLVPTMDGRTEIYTPAQLLATRALMDGAPGGDALIRETGCTYAVVRLGVAQRHLAADHEQLEVLAPFVLFRVRPD